MCPCKTRGCHVYLYQAFASSEQLSARVALFRRCCVVADTANSVRDAPNDYSAGAGGSRFSAFANHSAGATDDAASGAPDDAECPYSHRHGHGATPAPTGAHGKAGCARSGNDTAPAAANTDTNSNRNAKRDHRGATGCDVAVQPAPCVIEHHH